MQVVLSTCVSKYMHIFLTQSLQSNQIGFDENKLFYLLPLVQLIIIKP